MTRLSIVHNAVPEQVGFGWRATCPCKWRSRRAHTRTAAEHLATLHNRLSSPDGAA